MTACERASNTSGGRRWGAVHSGWGALPAQAQAPTRRPPSFAAGVDQIRVSVSVTDGHDRFVDGLAETDFTVFEDGVPQKLSFFTRDPLPLSVALLVDGSGSMQPNLAEAQAAGERFIRTLGPADLAQVVEFSDRMDVLQDFTADQARLVAAIRSTHASGATALYTTLYVTLKQLGSHRGTLESPRRRAIVLLTDGEDTASPASDEQVLEQARVADVGVYAIALRPASPRERQRLSFMEATHFLNALARETGAQVLLPGSASELDAAYARVAEELRTQYTLGYVSSNARRDGTLAADRGPRAGARGPADSPQARLSCGQAMNEKHDDLLERIRLRLDESFVGIAADVSELPAPDTAELLNQLTLHEAAAVHEHAADRAGHAGPRPADAAAPERHRRGARARTSRQARRGSLVRPAHRHRPADGREGQKAPAAHADRGGARRGGEPAAVPRAHRRRDHDHRVRAPRRPR